MAKISIIALRIRSLMTKKQREAIKEVITILREIRGDYGSTTQKGFTNKIDEKGANLALTYLINVKLAPKGLSRG
jgi:hypothetical protein